MEEVLIWAGLAYPEGHPTDAAISTTCPSCGHEQRLGEASFAEEEDEATYRCANCADVIVRIGALTTGIRIGNFAVASENPLYLILANGVAVKLPAAAPDDS